MACYLVPCGILHAEPVKVGVILPLSGEFAVPGDACRKGVELAASELNAQAVPVSILVQDSPSASAKTTLSAYHKLKSADGVEVFLGFVSSEELSAVGPQADRDGVALVAFVASRIKPNNSILVWMSPEVEARRFAEEIIRSYKTIAILSGNQEWEGAIADAFTQEFERLGGSVVLRVDSPFDSKDVRAAVLKVKHTSAQALLIPPYSLFSTYAKALRDLGIKLPIYSVELDQAAIDDSKGAAEGARVIRPSDPNGAFVKKYSNFFHGKLPDIPASQCYDGMKILGEAARQGAQHGRDFVAYFRSLKEYVGASGRVLFQQNDTVFSTDTLVVRNGRLVLPEVSSPRE